jgi:hypothetical protein
MSTVQFAVDQRLQGRSSWLRVVREKTEKTEKTDKTGQTVKSAQ